MTFAPAKGRYLPDDRFAFRWLDGRRRSLSQDGRRYARARAPTTIFSGSDRSFRFEAHARSAMSNGASHALSASLRLGKDRCETILAAPFLPRVATANHESSPTVKTHPGNSHRDRTVPPELFFLGWRDAVPAWRHAISRYLARGMIPPRVFVAALVGERIKKIPTTNPHASADAPRSARRAFRFPSQSFLPFPPPALSSLRP